MSVHGSPPRRTIWISGAVAAVLTAGLGLSAVAGSGGPLGIDLVRLKGNAAADGAEQKNKGGKDADKGGKQNALGLTKDESRAIALVNAARKAKKCGPVKAHKGLNRAAGKHSAVMVKRSKVASTGLGDGTPRSRANAQHYRGMVDEVVINARTPKIAVDRLVKSKDGTKVLLMCANADIGVGRSKNMWTFKLGAYM